MKFQIGRIAGCASLAFALAYSICAINRSGVVLFFILFGASFLATCTISYLLGSNRKYHLAKTLRDEFVEHLCRVKYYKSKGGSQICAIRRATDALAAGELKARAEEAERRYALGGTYLDNFAQISPDVLESNGSVDDAIRNYDLSLEAKNAEIEESAQRRATLNMFISTILPSFLVFAFVGNSILSQAEFGALQFSLALLLLVPLAYSLGNALMWRRLLV